MVWGTEISLLVTTCCDNSGRKVEEGESKNEKKETRKVLKVGDQNLTKIWLSQLLKTKSFSFSSLLLKKIMKKEGLYQFPKKKKKKKKKILGAD